MAKSWSEFICSDAPEIDLNLGVVNAAVTAIELIEEG